MRAREGIEVWPRLTKNSRELNDEDTMESRRIAKGESIRVTEGLPGGMMSHSQNEKNRRRSRARSQRQERDEKEDMKKKQDQRIKEKKENEEALEDMKRRAKEVQEAGEMEMREHIRMIVEDKKAANERGMNSAREMKAEADRRGITIREIIEEERVEEYEMLRREGYNEEGIETYQKKESEERANVIEGCD